jgi:hypothetical protein
LIDTGKLSICASAGRGKHGLGPRLRKRSDGIGAMRPCLPQVLAQVLAVDRDPDPVRLAADLETSARDQGVTGCLAEFAAAR